MRIRAAELKFENLKRFRELLDLDYSAFGPVMDNAEIVIENKGVKLAEISYNDRFAYFLLSGSVYWESGVFKQDSLRAGEKDANAMLNHLLPKGGEVLAAEDNTMIMIIKRRYISAARLDFRQTLETASENFGVVEANMEQKDDDDWMSILLASPLFQRVEPKNLQKLLLSFEERNYKAGETIIQGGQQGNYFYIIKSGRAEVLFIPQRDKEVTLEPGNFFGEGSLMGDTVHSATVKMKESGCVCLVPASVFDDIVKISVMEFVKDSELEQLLYSDDDPALVLDVRYPVEYRQGHRSGSINVPISKLRDRLHIDLTKDATYLLDYGEDKRSQVAALILIEQGFNAFLITEEPKQETQQEAQPESKQEPQQPTQLHSQGSGN